MRMPMPGETVHLLCKNCNHSFVGPCPDILGQGIFVNKVVENPKCPKCDSKKIILNPFVRY